MQNYLSYLGRGDDLQALFTLRLGTSRPARSSTDITNVLQMLAAASGKSIGKLGDELLHETPVAGSRFEGHYLRRYVNAGRKWLRGSAKPKMMSIGSALALIQSALQAGAIDEARAGVLLRCLDREDILGALAKGWREKKRAYPTTIKAWRQVWEMARIEAQAVWDGRPDWHKALVITNLGSRYEGGEVGIAEAELDEADMVEAIVRTVLSDAGASIVQTAVGDGLLDAGRVRAHESPQYKIGDVLTGSDVFVETTIVDGEKMYEEDHFLVYGLRTAVDP
ncbi:hypothetical protein [Trinickia acidisoli]|uniref:hypothetical protein n=1 Tax=Trinickia acidisoli TaxID=2767482 RepID=UPI001A8D4B21|nr:hypothetical protein [Trinickia acidisoli]